MSSPRVWVTGSGGLIGSHLIRTAPQYAPERQVHPWTRAALDLTDFAAVKRAFKEYPPDAIIHCAALSRSGACQENPALAELMNVTVTEHLSRLAERIPFIFFSTDLVFDGRKGRYSETDSVNPLSTYAETKVKAEACVLRNPLHTVVRTSLNTGVSPTGNKSFTEEMRQQWQRGEAVKLFTDEFRSPIPASVTARAVWELLTRRVTGLLHLAGVERLSRWQIGRAVATRNPGLQCRIESLSIKDFVGTPRPADTTLNCSKVEAHLSFQLPALTIWMRENPAEPV